MAPTEVLAMVGGHGEEELLLRNDYLAVENGSFGALWQKTSCRARAFVCPHDTQAQGESLMATIGGRLKAFPGFFSSAEVKESQKTIIPPWTKFSAGTADDMATTRPCSHGATAPWSSGVTGCQLSLGLYARVNGPPMPNLAR